MPFSILNHLADSHPSPLTIELNGPAHSSPNTPSPHSPAHHSPAPTPPPDLTHLRAQLLAHLEDLTNHPDDNIRLRATLGGLRALAQLDSLDLRRKRLAQHDRALNIAQQHIDLMQRREQRAAQSVARPARPCSSPDPIPALTSQATADSSPTELKCHADLNSHPDPNSEAAQRRYSRSRGREAAETDGSIREPHRGATAPDACGSSITQTNPRALATPTASDECDSPDDESDDNPNPNSRSNLHVKSILSGLLSQIFSVKGEINDDDDDDEDDDNNHPSPKPPLTPSPCHPDTSSSHPASQLTPEELTYLRSVLDSPPPKRPPDSARLTLTTTESAPSVLTAPPTPIQSRAP